MFCDILKSQLFFTSAPQHHHHQWPVPAKAAMEATPFAMQLSEDLFIPWERAARQVSRLHATDSHFSVELLKPVMPRFKKSF